MLEKNLSDVKKTGRRPVILTFVAYYLPGYKAGGILRTIANTVALLGEEFEFRIVTQDRDLGDRETYHGIIPQVWETVGGALVYYMPPSTVSIRAIAQIIRNTAHDILYINSFFDATFTIRVLLARRLGLIPRQPAIIAPRGELVEGCIRLKYRKKMLFIRAAGALGLYKNLEWQASTPAEVEDFVRVLGVERRRIYTAIDLPARVEEGDLRKTQVRRDPDRLHVVFVSRLTREKNIDYALRVMKQVCAQVNFDIYGPQEDPIYWNECLSLIKQQPSNVRVSYKGCLRPDEVIDVVRGYDIFFFPSRGENYGHVIAEALTAGVPVLISDTTPWRNLQERGMGWDIALNNPNDFANIIESVAHSSDAERGNMRARVRQRAMEQLWNPDAIAANRKLFNDQMARTS